MMKCNECQSLTAKEATVSIKSLARTVLIVGFTLTLVIVAHELCSGFEAMCEASKNGTPGFMGSMGQVAK